MFSQFSALVDSRNGIWPQNSAQVTWWNYVLSFHSCPSPFCCLRRKCRDGDKGMWNFWSFPRACTGLDQSRPQAGSHRHIFWVSHCQYSHHASCSSPQHRLRTRWTLESTSPGWSTNTHIFYPVAIETADRWHDMAVELIQEIGGRITRTNLIHGEKR